MLLLTLILTTIDIYLIFDFIKHMSNLLLSAYKEGICESCRNCEYFGICKGLTEFRKDMCELRMKYDGINT